MVLDTRQVREEQQLAEVGAGIAEADRGEFVKEDDVAGWLPNTSKRPLRHDT